jgi:predicted  nucleic acid-binding Zn-ribbon protein
MMIGAERAQAQPHSGGDIEQDQASHAATADEALNLDAYYTAEAYTAGPEHEAGRPLLAVLLILVAVAWTGAAIWSFAATNARPGLQDVVGFAATVAAPLVLLCLLWMIFGRTPRRESERFTRAVTAMRHESAALDSLLAVVSARLEENYARLTGESAKLMTLGDEASDRLGRITHYIAKETANLDRRANALESAANAARVDIGVLLDDLPRAEERARSLAQTMQEVGLTAHGQAGALDAQVSSLVARGREADEVAGGAAQRLAAHLARIESSVGAAAQRLEQAAGTLGGTVDDSLARASEALDATRDGLHAQSVATLAMIEKSSIALDKAGSDAARSLSRRIETLAAQLDSLAGQLSSQDAQSHALVGRLGRELEGLEQRFAGFAESSQGNAAQYADAVASIRATVDALHEELGGSQQRADGLIHRAQILAQALTAVTQSLHVQLPAALSRVEEQAGKTHEVTSALRPQIEIIEATSNAAAGQMANVEETLLRQQELLHGLTDRLETVSANVGDLDGNARKLIAETGPELVEALIRVRETANQAAAYARETIAAVIPESAAALGKAGTEAVQASVAPHLEEQMATLAAAAERAMERAQQASERLTRQIVTIGETTAAIEARITDAREEQERSDSEAFARRVALLMESLNSTAIDVAKILSNEVSDSAWAAYLKGDRGAFTRRAVRLLNSGEAREIGRQYENDPEFREQVNRYVHDFEAMLRRILADKEGATLGVTILSSDMGKLYVALAQAIERLRT